MPRYGSYKRSKKRDYVGHSDYYAYQRCIWPAEYAHEYEAYHTYYCRIYYLAGYEPAESFICEADPLRNMSALSSFNTASTSFLDWAAKTSFLLMKKTHMTMPIKKSFITFNTPKRPSDMPVRTDSYSGSDFFHPCCKSGRHISEPLLHGSCIWGI